MLASEVLTHKDTLKILKISKGQCLYGANMRCKINCKPLYVRTKQLTENKGKTNLTDK